MYEIFDELIKQKGLSAYKVAKDTGISQTTLSDWKRDIKPGMLILYRETWYVIDRVDTFEGYKEDLKLLAKEAAQSEIPPVDNIVPYGG